MYLRRRIGEVRLQRVRARARASVAFANPLIQLAEPGHLTHPRVPPPRDSWAEWSDKPGGRRRSRRVSVAGEMALRRSGGFSFQVQLGDVSATGCKVELIELVDIRERVIARFPGLEPLGARVAWVDEHSAGIEFERAIYPAVFDLLLSRLP